MVLRAFITIHTSTITLTACRRTYYKTKKKKKNNNNNNNDDDDDNNNKTYIFYSAISR